MNIITRREAKSRGLSRYFTGKPCKHGHIALRDTVNGSCIECSWKKQNPELNRQYARDYYVEHREEILDRIRVPEKEKQNRAVRPYSAYRHDPYWPAYYHQRRHAGRRGVAWKLTFPQWLKIWKQSGKLTKRGRDSGQYVMARNGDKGSYSVGNVSIITNRQNSIDGHNKTLWDDPVRREKQSQRMRARWRQIKRALNAAPLRD